MTEREFAYRAEDILQEARRLADDVDSWADFSNALYAEPDGLLILCFPGKYDRRRFVGSPQGIAVKVILRGLQRRFGLTEGSTPRLPPSEFP